MDIGELIAWYLERLECQRPESVAQQAAPLVRLLGRHSAQALRGVDITEYRARRRGEGVSDSTANRELTYLRAAFRKALRLELPGIDRMPHVEMVREPEGRTGWLTAQQVEQVALYLDRHDPLGDFVRFAALTGWRKSAIAGLEWVDVDPHRGLIEMPARLAKSRRSVRFPLEGAVLDVVRRRLAAASYAGQRPRLVFHRSGAPVRSFAKAWASAIRAAGVSPKRIFHDLRRSFVVSMGEAGVSDAIVMRLCDMSPPTLSRYRQTRIDDLREAVRAAARGDPRRGRDAGR